MNKIYDRFTNVDTLKEKYYTKAIYSYNIKTNKFNVFVEGEDDVLFYKSCLTEKIIKNYKIIRFPTDITFIPVGSKRNVIKLCEYLNQNDKKKVVKKFIVDKDYDINYKQVVNLIYLPCYSIENFYFIKENFDETLAHFLNIDHTYIDIFKNNFLEILDELKIYFLCKLLNVELGCEEYNINNFDKEDIVLENKIQLSQKYAKYLNDIHLKIKKRYNDLELKSRLNYISDIKNIRGKDLTLLLSMYYKLTNHLEFDRKKLLSFSKQLYIDINI